MLKIAKEQLEEISIIIKEFLNSNNYNSQCYSSCEVQRYTRAENEVNKLNQAISTMEENKPILLKATLLESYLRASGKTSYITEDTSLVKIEKYGKSMDIGDGRYDFVSYNIDDYKELCDEERLLNLSQSYISSILDGKSTFEENAVIHKILSIRDNNGDCSSFYISAGIGRLENIELLISDGGFYDDLIVFDYSKMLYILPINQDMNRYIRIHPYSSELEEKLIKSIQRYKQYEKELKTA